MYFNRNAKCLLSIVFEIDFVLDWKMKLIFLIVEFWFLRERESERKREKEMEIMDGIMNGWFFGKDDLRYFL